MNINHPERQNMNAIRSGSKDMNNDASHSTGNYFGGGVGNNGAVTTGDGQTASFVTMVDDASDYGSRFETIDLTAKDLAHSMNCTDNALLGFAVDGENYKPSGRFVRGLASRLKVPTSVFGLFSPQEVIDRAADRVPNLPLRLTVDHTKHQALGLVEGKGKVLPIGQITGILRNDERLTKLEYEDGVIHATLNQPDEWDIPGDSEYRVQICCQVPVDGMGQPEINLATLRRICSNGAVARETVFRTKMEIKDNSGLHFHKLLRSFNNRNGVELLQQRLMEAYETKASVGEVMAVDSMLCKQISDRHARMLLREQLLNLAGNPCVRYGVVDLSTISEKRRALLPTSCSVADLLNFTSELGTHHRDLLKNAMPLQSFYGHTLANGFDLEGLYKNENRARDFHLNRLNLASV